MNRRLLIPGLIVALVLLAAIVLMTAPNQAGNLAPLPGATRVSITPPARPSTRALAFGLDATGDPAALAWFESICRPGDWVILRPQDVAAVANLKCGTKTVIFNSYTEAAAALPNLAGEINAIGYDPEHRTQTPAAEQTDPVGALVKFDQLATKNNLLTTIGPDRNFDVSNGVGFAPYVYQYTLQLQQFGYDLPAIHKFSDGLIAQLRAANPKIRIVAQLRADLTVPQLLDIAHQVDLDGISIIFNPDRLQTVKDFVVAAHG